MLFGLEIAHEIVDLIMQASHISTSANTSPSTPQSPSTNNPPSRHSHFMNPNQVVPYKQDQLMRLKIFMRESEHPSRPKHIVDSSSSVLLASSKEDSASPAATIGQNVGTVRYLFGPPAVVGNAV